MGAAAGRLGGYLRNLLGLGGLVAVGAGWIYLTSGQGRLEYLTMPGTLWGTVAAVACAGAGLLLLSTNLFDRLPWHGVMPARVAAGHGWSRSIASRLLVVLFGGGLIWSWTGLVGMAFQAWYQTDWSRLAIVVLFAAAGAALSLRAVWSAFSFAPRLVVDAEGLVVTGDRLAWSQIEKIGAGGDPASRQVYLFLNTGRALGPARALSFSETGLTAGGFLAAVEAVAPQVAIERAEPRRAVFGAA